MRRFPFFTRRKAPAGPDLAGFLDLFDDHVYTGEISADGRRYVTDFSGPTLERFIGAPLPEGTESGTLWTSLVDPADRATYDEVSRRLAAGVDVELTYRMRGLDGVTRWLWHRARAHPRPDGGTRIQGIVSDITNRVESDARLAAANDRFHRLLDVVGEHVYVALMHPDGRMEEIFQGPGADRLLGGAVPDSGMENWFAAIHPDDRAAVEAFDRTLAAGVDADVEYRLLGLDGVTRWVHDRATARSRDDGTVEVSGIVGDVTERRRMREELARVVEAMDDHLYTLSVEPGGGYRSVYRGPNRERLAGGPLPDGDPERAWETLVHPEDRARWQAGIAALADGGAVDLEYRVTGVDRTERVVLDRLRPRREADGSLLYDGVTRDITERRRLEDELRRARSAAEALARTDELTGAFNRRHFAEIVGQALAAGASDCGLLLLDADHFKHINDAHGHLAGDAVLVELVRRLRAGLQPDDCLARWGGEEFAILLRAIDSDAELERRARLLAAAVAATPVRVHAAGVQLTVSIGAARAVAPLTSLDALVEHADRGLYLAKRDGRNRVSLLQGSGV